MRNHLLTIGYEIPGFGEHNLDFYDRFSLMDADILLISTDSISPIGERVSFTAGGGCFNVEPSKRFEESILHLKKELLDFLNSGKTAFILLSPKEDFLLSTSVTSLRKGQHTYNTKIVNNYDFLPINIGSLTSAYGKLLKFSGNPIFSLFHKNFNSYLEYHIYIENTKSDHVIYSGKDMKKILSAVYNVGVGHLVVLPMLNYDEAGFIDIKKEKNGTEDEFWNKKGLAFGNSLFSTLIDIDRKLADATERTPVPEWILQTQYTIEKEIITNRLIEKNLKTIAKLELENERLKSELLEDLKLKDLLFEKGKILESAVTKALKILGYQAEGFNDGTLEIDQIIISPEKHRYIGECEGKDSKDIDVSKFRQLQDALNADFARDEVEEKAFGILFGNADRLTNPKDRKFDFTQKCKSGAEREKIALIKTIDLFVVSKYLSEQDDPLFKKACREAIHKCLGKVVEFPPIPD